MTEKITTIEALAVMIQRTMASKEDLKAMASKEDLVQLRTEMQDGFHAVNRRIDLLREDISDLPEIREEIQEHGERLTRVERKVGFAA